MLKTTFLGIELENCLMNASGVHCMSVQELNELGGSAAGAFVTKTATRDYRAGNPEPRYYDTKLGSINSMGLPNNGFDYYLDYVLERQKQGAKLQFLSVTGMSYEENIDIAHFDAMAEILNKFPLTYVNSVNSVGNGLYIDLDKEEVVIKPKGGFGGIGGEYIKPTALANVRAFRQRLNKDIKIIGTGGVTNGRDVFEHILCGADLVQVGTILHQEGVGVFERLVAELEEVMREKGYSSIEDFKGKLKTLD